MQKIARNGAGYLFLFLLALACLDSCAQRPLIERIDVVEYGTYSADLLTSQRDAQGIGLDTSNHVKNLVTTHEVTAQIGVRFGFRFRLVGAPYGAKVNLRKVTIYPPQGLRTSPGSQPIHSHESALAARIDADIVYTAYRFTDPWELVPGAWTFEVWYGDRKLVSQIFTVRNP